MASSIPTFKLDDFSDAKDIFCIETQKDLDNMPLHLPYRTAYYGIGMVLSGTAILNVNLESYTIKKNTIITLSPETIKQWLERSKNLSTITVFFTKAFFSAYYPNLTLPGKFGFYNIDAVHAHLLPHADSNLITELLLQIKSTIKSTNLYKKEIAASFLNIAFHEYLTHYNTLTHRSKAPQTRSGQISAEFKKLVNEHYLTQRKVSFYADQLFITPKHLSEIIKSENGKTAGEWIDEMVILESKILLQNPTLTIAQITDILNFSDQSAFGKFFKNITNLSPLAFRQTL